MNIRRITVLGAGTMGHGIAHAAAAAGFETSMYDVSKAAVEKGRQKIDDIFKKGVKIEVGDMLPSRAYADRLQRVPKAWEKAFEVNAGESEAIRASCVEFVLAGLHATDRISRSAKHGRIVYET